MSLKEKIRRLQELQTELFNGLISDAEFHYLNWEVLNNRSVESLIN